MPLYAEPADRHRPPFHHFWAVLLVVGIGVMSSLFFFRYTQDQERSLAQANFERDTINIAASLSKDINRYSDLLNSVRRYFEASDEVSRDDFRLFCGDPSHGLPGIQAIEWVPRIPLVERTAYEQAGKSDGFAAFRITERDANGALVPAASRAEYFPVYYVEPYAGNETALGHDPQLPERLDALLMARDTGKDTATRRFTLIQEKDNQAGVALFLPIYRGKAPETVAERREQLRGFAEGVFRVGDMVEASLAGLSVEGIGLRLVDLTEPAAPELLFVRGEQAGGEQTREARASRFESAIDFGGRRWGLTLYPLARGPERLPPAYIILFGGLFVTGLTGTYLYREATRNAKIAQTVAERTAELRAAIETSAFHQAERDKAHELDRLKTNFVAVVSHDLRTPLTSIMGYAEFLEDGIGGDLAHEQLDFVTQIMASAQRLEALVNDLLDFAKLDAGTFKLTLAITDLQAKLHEVAESFRPQIENAKLTLEVEAPGIPLLVQMDVARVERVLINLLSNAIKFTPVGERIRLQARLSGDEIVCEVHDTGSGIASEDVPKLFQRFSQLSTGEVKGGTGLGLSICKAIIEAHGGTIGVRSAVGLGSTFWFTLPAMAPSAVAPLLPDQTMAQGGG